MDLCCIKSYNKIRIKAGKQKNSLGTDRDKEGWKNKKMYMQGGGKKTGREKNHSHGRGRWEVTYGT